MVKPILFFTQVSFVMVVSMALPGNGYGRDKLVPEFPFQMVVDGTNQSFFLPQINRFYYSFIDNDNIKALKANDTVRGRRYTHEATFNRKGFIKRYTGSFTGHKDTVLSTYRFRYKKGLIIETFEQTYIRNGRISKINYEMKLFFGSNKKLDSLVKSNTGIEWGGDIVKTKESYACHYDSEGKIQFVIKKTSSVDTIESFSFNKAVDESLSLAEGDFPDDTIISKTVQVNKIDKTVFVFYQLPAARILYKLNKSADGVLSTEWNPVKGGFIPNYSTHTDFYIEKRFPYLLEYRNVSSSRRGLDYEISKSYRDKHLIVISPLVNDTINFTCYKRF
jgi:hypothetical protein